MRTCGDVALIKVSEQVMELEQLEFNFRNKPQAYSYCVVLSGGMQHYNDADLLKALYHVPGVSWM